MSKQILNIKNIKGMFRSEGTDIQPDMAYDLQNLFTDTTLGMLEGGQDYTTMDIESSTSTPGLKGALNGAEVYDIAFFSPSKEMEFESGNGMVKTRRVVIALVNSGGTVMLKLFPVISDSTLLYFASKDIEVSGVSDVTGGKIIPVGDTARLVFTTATDNIVKWFGYVSKYMFYIDGEPKLDIKKWMIEDAIITLSGMSIDIEEGEYSLYEEDEPRFVSMAISPVYDYVQDGNLIYSKVLETIKSVKIILSVDLREQNEGGVSRRLTGIKVWRKIAANAMIVADIDWELLKTYGVAYDTNEEFDNILFTTEDTPHAIRSLKHLQSYRTWLPSGSNSIEYDTDDFLPHLRFPEWRYIIPFNRDEAAVTPQDGTAYFIRIDGSTTLYQSEYRYLDVAESLTVKKVNGKWCMDAPWDNWSRALFHVTRFLDGALEVELVYGQYRLVEGVKTMITDYPVHDYIQTWIGLDFNLTEIIRFFTRTDTDESKVSVYQPASILTLWDKMINEVRMTPMNSFLMHGQGGLEFGNLSNGIMAVNGNVPELTYSSVGLRVLFNGNHIIEFNDAAMLFGNEDVDAFTSSVQIFNDPMGFYTISMSGVILNIIKNDNLAIDGETRIITVAVTSNAAAVVEFEEISETELHMSIDDQSDEMLHTNIFYTEQVGFDKRNIVKHYSDAVWFANRIFVIDGSKIRWSEPFKYDSFRPESAYEAKQRPLKILPHKNVLVAFYETDIEILDYSGTKETWRTKDTIDKTGTSLLESIISTPTGIYFANRYGVYRLVMPEQTGLYSYFKKERLDEPIESLIDYREATGSDIISYYDPRMNRVVFRDNRDMSEFIINRYGGWMRVTKSDYKNLTKIITAHDNLQIGLCQLLDNDPTFANLERNGRHLGDYVFETQWIDLGEPHVDKKFIRADMIIKIPSAEPTAINEIADIGVIGMNGAV